MRITHFALMFLVFSQWGCRKSTVEGHWHFAGPNNLSSASYTAVSFQDSVIEDELGKALGSYTKDSFFLYGLCGVGNIGYDIRSNKMYGTQGSERPRLIALRVDSCSQSLDYRLDLQMKVHLHLPRIDTVKAAGNYFDNLKGQPIVNIGIAKEEEFFVLSKYWLQLNDQCCKVEDLAQWLEIERLKRPNVPFEQILIFADENTPKSLMIDLENELILNGVTIFSYAVEESSTGKVAFIKKKHS